MFPKCIRSVPMGGDPFFRSKLITSEIPNRVIYRSETKWGKFTYLGGSSDKIPLKRESRHPTLSSPMRERKRVFFRMGGGPTTRKKTNGMNNE